jgi:hypothetical protein
MKPWIKLTSGSCLLASLVVFTACRTTDEDSTVRNVRDNDRQADTIVGSSYVYIGRDMKATFNGQGMYTDGINVEMRRTMGCQLEPLEIKIKTNYGDSHAMYRYAVNAESDTTTWKRYIPRPVGLPMPQDAGDGSLPLGLPELDQDTQPQGLPLPVDEDPRPVGLPAPEQVTQISVVFDLSEYSSASRGCYIKIRDFVQSTVQPVGLPMPSDDDEVRPVGLPMPNDGDEVRPVGLPMPSDDDEVRPVGLPMPNDENEVRPVGLPMPDPRPVGLPMPTDEDEVRPVGLPMSN